MLSLRALLSTSFSPVRVSAAHVCRRYLSSTPVRSASFGAVCFNCGKPGHLQPQCPKPLTCHRCGGEGHIWSVCPTHDPLLTPVKACRRCGEKDHDMKKCTKPVTCYRCGSAKHMLAACAQPPAQ